MIMQDNEKKPALRFKGFTDPWEQRKLAELTKTITTGKSVNSDEGEVSDGDIGVLKTSCVSYDRFNPSESKPVVKSEQQLVKCAVEKDSVIVSRMNTPERVGACGYVSTDFPNLFLPDRLWKLKFQDTVDTYFVYMMLVSSAYKEKITSMASGTSGSMYNIPKETFLNLQLVIPAKIDEQKQLGKILKKIDTLITLHQRKYEKLVNIKKSMLDKMFPQNGASVPEIRFKGFTDPWEQRKVREVTDRYDNLRIPVAASLRVAGTTPYYGANGIQDYVEGYTHDGEFILVAEDGANDLKNYPVKCVKGRIWVNNHAHVLQGKCACADNQFLAYAISQADIESLLVGGGRAKLNAETLMDIELLLPSKDEQIQIGHYLARLDHLITLHQRKLEKLQNIKKSCLEKMFV